MQPKAFNALGVQFAWDSTSIKLAETCLRKYQYKMIDGWQPLNKSVHLLFGGWYASALELYHKLVAQKMDAEDAVVLVVQKALEDTWVYDTCEECHGTGKLDITEEARKEMTWAGRVDWAETECDNCEATGKLQSGKPWASDHNTKTRENLIRTIVWYLDQYGEDDSMKTIISSEGTALVEHTFALPVDNGIIFAGHLDRVVEYAHSPYVQDQKTTGSTISARFFDGFSPDSQMSMYTFAGRSIFGIPVKGIVIDAAQIAVGFTRFERGFTFRTESQLNEWYDNTLYTIEVAQAASRENHFPMNPSSCSNFGGCEFRHICSRSPEVREQFLKADFVRGERWDPLRAR